MNKIKTIATTIILIISLQAVAQLSEVSGTGIANLRSSMLSWGDMNNDGLIDVLISGINNSGTKQCKLYSNNGDDTFTDRGISIVSLTDGDISLIDFNHDNFLDIAVSGRDQSSTKYSKLYKNNGNNSFTEVSASLQGLAFGSTDWADYDNDGDYDLLLTGQDENNVRKTLIYENIDGNNFTEIVPNIPGISRGEARWGDFNNDGFIDIAISGLDNSNNYITEIYKNNGNKTFSSHNANLDKLAYSTIHWVDYDNDGDLDLWISGNDNTSTDYIKLYKNGPGNTFTDISAGFNALWNVSAHWGDYDADGDVDLAYLGLDNTTPTVYYYQNDGSDNFSLVDLSIDALAEGDLAWGDYTNNNKLDLLISGSGSGGTKTILYKNISASANTRPTKITGLTANVNGKNVSLSWNTGSDTESSSTALSYRLSISTTPGGLEVLSPMANLSTGISFQESTGLIKTTSITIKNLDEGKYYWNIRSVDPSFKTSEFADEASFSICNPVNLGADQQICTQSQLNLSAGTDDDVVNWYSESAGLIASDTKTLVYTITQNDKISVEIIKSIGCTVKDTIEVSALALPVISLPATKDICYADTLKLEAGTGNETVKWYAENGSLIHDGKVLEYIITQNQIIKAEVTTTETCMDSAKVAIHTLALPQASLGDDYPVCTNSSTTLQISDMQNVDWYALPLTAIANDTNQIQLTVTTDTTIVAKFYNTAGCSNKDTVNITASALPSVNAGNDTTICANTGLTLGALPVANGGLPPYSYSWMNENKQVISNIANPTVNPTTNTFYSLVVKDQLACKDSDIINVTLNPKSIIDAGADVEICYGDNSTLGGNPTAQNSLFFYNYSWTPINGLSDASDANPIATPLETTTYRLIVSSYKCAEDTAFVTVKVNPLPEVTTSGDVTIGFDETTIIKASGGVSYEWSPTDGLQDPYSAQTEASPETTSTYVVTVTDENECVNKGSIKITVRNDLFIPNLFTPNNDGKNDFFKIYGNGIKEITLVVYNRNGNIVYKSNNVNELLETGWDGTYRGINQAEGVYIWVISGYFVDGSKIKYQNNKGTINLMR